MEDFGKALLDAINIVLQKQLCMSLKRVKEKYKNNFIIVDVVNELMKRYKCEDEEWRQ